MWSSLALPRAILIASWAVPLIVWALLALRAKRDVVKQKAAEQEDYSLAFVAGLLLTVLPLRGPLNADDGGVAVLSRPCFPRARRCTGPAR